MIKELKPEEKERWDEFVKNHPNSLISHLYDWKRIEYFYPKATKIIHLIAEEDNKIVGVMSFFIQNRKITSHSGFLVLNKNAKVIQEEFMVFLDTYTKKERLIGIQILSEPNTIPDEQMSWLLNYGYERKISKTVILSLIPSLDEIWKNLHKSARTDVRKATKNGVKVVKATRGEEVEDFYELYLAMCKTNKIKPHPISFYYTFWDYFKDHCDFFFATYEGKKIATALISKYNKKAVYLSGPSLTEYRHLSPNHLVQWNIITYLKENGFESYELGAAGHDSPDSKVKGIARFKMSLGELGDNITWTKYRTNYARKIDELYQKIPLGKRVIIDILNRKREVKKG